MYYKIEYISKGEKKEIIIKANNIKEAINKFKNKKIGLILNISEFEKEEGFSFFSSINMEEFIAILEQMYVMLDAGIGIDSIIDSIKENIKNKKLKKIFESISNDIKAGYGLSAAFEKHKDDLGYLTIAMLKLAEETGDLAKIIKDLANILSEIQENKRRLKKATRYPIFIVFAMFVAFIIVILFVIPPFKSIFKQLKQDLPLPTRFLLWIENAAVTFGPYILIGAVIISIVLNYLYKKDDKVRLFFDKMLLKMYVVGQVMYLAMIGRFIMVLKELVRSGIPIVDAINISLNIVDNTYIRHQLEKIKSSVISGSGIAKGFEESRLFEPMVIQMIRSAEESGALVFMFDKISNYYLSKYKYIVDNIAVMIEPILIAAIAGFIFTLGLGIFLPMWTLTNIAGQ
jgi:general secretion pathway protein F